MKRNVKAAALGLAGLGFGLAAPAARALTIVIDFKETGEPNTTAITNDVVGAFDVTTYGFTAGQYVTLQNSIMAEMVRDYRGIPTAATDIRSPIPAGRELNIDFVIGNIGSAPSNGDAEYYYVQVGAAVSGPNTGGGTLGVAGLSVARNASGTPGINGRVVGSVFTNNIRTLGGLTPSNALSSGNLALSTYAIEGTLAHELGHALSLLHVAKAGSVTPSGVSPLMGTGAIDLPNQDRITDREFSYSGIMTQNGSAVQFDVQQLVGAIGTRAVPEPAGLAVLVGVVGLLGARRRRRA